MRSGGDEDVPRLDKLEDGGLGFAPRAKTVLDEQLAFERRIEAHVAALELPLVILFEHERTDKPDDRGGIRKMPTTSVCQV